MLKQIAIFAQNTKGALQKITQILFDEQINIMGSVTNDSAEYGIIRMVVSEPEKAKKALTAAGYMCQLNQVLGVEVEDQPGNLNQLLTTLSESNVTINYIYLRKADYGSAYSGYPGSRRVPAGKRIYTVIIHDYTDCSMLCISVFTLAGVKRTSTGCSAPYRGRVPRFCTHFCASIRGHRPFDTVIKIKFSLDRCSVR